MSTTETTQEPGTLAAQLTEARKQRGWTLREAEKRTGVSNAHLSQIETGAILRPSLDTLVPLAAVYGLPLDELAEASGHDVEAIRELSGTGVRVTIIAAEEPDSMLPPPVADFGPVRLELMGHRYREGNLSEVVIAGQPFLRLDLKGGAGVEFYRPDAVYCITPGMTPPPVQRAEIPADLQMDGYGEDEDEWSDD